MINEVNILWHFKGSGHPHVVQLYGHLTCFMQLINSVMFTLGITEGIPGIVMEAGECDLEAIITPSFQADDFYYLDGGQEWPCTISAVDTAKQKCTISLTDSTVIETSWENMRKEVY